MIGVSPLRGFAAYSTSVLADFFELAAPADLSEAASQLVGLLRSQVDLFRRTSPAAASVFDDVAGAMVVGCAKMGFSS